MRRHSEAAVWIIPPLHIVDKHVSSVERLNKELRASIIGPLHVPHRLDLEAEIFGKLDSTRALVGPVYSLETMKKFTDIAHRGLLPNSIVATRAWCQNSPKRYTMAAGAPSVRAL
jgi:hypothetical protein